LRQVNPQVKVLLASGYSPNSSTDDVLGTGARGFIQKPYALAEILGRVRAVLDEP
jgi:two-component system cell cycle sensor histidine kinase/response regulator CckA